MFLSGIKNESYTLQTEELIYYRAYNEQQS
jgi:hypothetical protein